MVTLEQYLERKYSSTSVKGYKNIIIRYLLTVGDRAEKATYNDVLNYIGILREANLHPKSLRNNLFTIKIYYSYLVEIGKREDHPCQYLYLKDQINRQIQVESLYSKEELKSLYENWKSKSIEFQDRDKIIISLLIYQALTVLEITSLKLSSIDLEQGIIKIKGNSKNKARILSLKPNQILLFLNYLKDDRKNYLKEENDYFLMNKYGLQLWKGSINRIINKEKDKQNKLLPLKIRQSVIANLLKSGVDIRIVQEFSGHRRTASTEAYKQTGLEELKSIIERLHPLKQVLSKKK